MWSLLLRPVRSALYLKSILLKTAYSPKACVVGLWTVEMAADIWGLIGNGSLSMAAHYVVNLLKVLCEKSGHF